MSDVISGLHLELWELPKGDKVLLAIFISNKLYFKVTDDKKYLISTFECVI